MATAMAQTVQETNPILPASNEAVWAFVSFGLALVALVVVLILVRWAGFQLGFHVLGRVSRR